MAALAVASVGCSRPRHGPVPPTPPPIIEPSAAAAAASEGDDAPPTQNVPLRIDQPVAEAAVSSPVRVAGVVRPQAGRVYVVQVIVAGARPDVRGNARIEIDPVGGAFSVDVPYVLAAAADGTVEISVVDPVGGTVADRARVPVRLAAAP